MPWQFTIALISNPRLFTLPLVIQFTRDVSKTLVNFVGRGKRGDNGISPLMDLVAHWFLCMSRLASVIRAACQRGKTETLCFVKWDELWTWYTMWCGTDCRDMKRIHTRFDNCTNYSNNFKFMWKFWTIFVSTYWR